jgi:hypothetical protein
MIERTGTRAVVADDAHTIALLVYSRHSADLQAAVALEPLTALRVAYELIGAATRHLNRDASCSR